MKMIQLARLHLLSSLRNHTKKVNIVKAHTERMNSMCRAQVAFFSVRDRLLSDKESDLDISAVDLSEGHKINSNKLSHHSKKNVGSKSSWSLSSSNNAQRRKRKEKTIEPDNYFENMWLQNLADGNSESTNGSESSEKSQQRMSRDIFGTIGNERYQQKDERHPNERLQEHQEFHAETKDRDFRLGIPLTRYGRFGRTAIYYNRKISKLGKQGKIREAIAVYDELMMLQDRVLPKKRTFVTLMGILGRVGYTRKAFQLFRQMRMLGFDAEDHIYTSLFNACANAPSAEDGLARAEKLIRYMQENGIKPNLYTVKSCMKALAVTGDFPRAFAVLDEAATRLQLDSDCFNALLIACASDRSAGFLRAMLVWRKMGEMQIQPQISTFNLLLRCVRDCSIGDPHNFHESLGLTGGENNWMGIESGHSLVALESERSKLYSVSNCFAGKSWGGQSNQGLNHRMSTEKLTEDISDLPQNVTTPSHIRENSNLIETELQVSNYDENRISINYGSTKEISPHTVDKNILEGRNSEWWEKDLTSQSQLRFNRNHSSTSCKHQLSTSAIDMKKRVGSSVDSLVLHDQPSLVKVKELQKAEARLALLGGTAGLLGHMKDCRVSPDLKTFAQILACLPNDKISEADLLETMKKMEVSPDVDVLNDIMMRRYRRKEYDQVQEVLKTISEFNLTANMRTYAALALTCNTKDKALHLIDDIKKAGLEPSAEVMSHLMMASFTNFAYKLQMLKIYETLGYKPTTRILTNIETSISSAKRKISEAEKNDHESFYLSDAYTIPLRNFLNYYRQWLQRTEMDKPEHPWKAFEPKTDDSTNGKLN